MERRFFEDAKNAPAKAGAAKQLGTKEEFMVASADCAAPGAVWWTRRGVYYYRRKVAICLLQLKGQVGRIFRLKNTRSGCENYSRETR